MVPLPFNIIGLKPAGFSARASDKHKLRRSAVRCVFRDKPRTAKMRHPLTCPLAGRQKPRQFTVSPTIFVPGRAASSAIRILMGLKFRWPHLEPNLFLVQATAARYDLSHNKV